MKEVKEVNKVRERTRHELDSPTLKRAPNKIRTTAQKGIEESQLQTVL
jgi:hypothetical protein